MIVTFRNYTSSRIGIVSRAACARRTGPGNCEVDGSGLGEAVVRGVGGDGYRDLSVHSGGRGVVVRCGGGSGIRRGEWNEQGVLLLVVVGWCGVLVSKDRTGQDRKWVWCCWRPAVARVGCGLWPVVASVAMLVNSVVILVNTAYAGVVTDFHMLPCSVRPTRARAPSATATTPGMFSGIRRSSTRSQTRTRYGQCYCSTVFCIRAVVVDFDGPAC